jgi:uncharacterized protein (DUF1800 family)
MNLKNPISRWLTTGLLLPLFVSLAQAVPIALWQIGEDEDPFANGYNPANEFSDQSGNTNAAPGLVTRLVGDPLYNATSNPTRDDHFYQAGTYPVGFNGITTALVVPNPEPFKAFERALANGDPNKYIHFILTAAQASATSRLRLSFELVNGGSYSSITNTSGENFGSHNIEVRFRTATANTLILQRTGIDRTTRLTLDIPASSVTAVAGANTIQITRTGPTLPTGVSSYVQFDFVKMEVDSDAMTDGDADGLPRWWERENALSDTNPADATADKDADGLTALQEYHGGVMPSDPHRKDTDGDGATDAQELTAGSNPNLVDTDGDGLDDDKEILTTPTSSPLLTDTDADGAPDAWEKRVGTNPTLATSKPTVFPGAIGLNFVCGDDPRGSVPWLTPAGVIPQLRWNNTLPLRSYSRPSGGTGDIISPAAGVISNAAGQPLTAMTVRWTAKDTSNTTNNGTADQKLLNGYLRAEQDNPATLTVQGIPFAKYHIFAYVGGSYDGQQASVKLNNESDTNRLFYTASTAPRKDLVEIKPLTLANPIQVGNYVRYEDRVGASFTLTVTNLDGYSLGLHAIQIVDATLDSDNSGIPDWYEMQYALQPAGASTANADPDGDGLTNFQEFQRRTDPRLADTDGDGLADNQESAANALTVDSDGDGLSDAAEAKSPLPSNPNLADSDGDGISDKQETKLGLDPSVNPTTTPGFVGWVPVYSAAAATWEWKLDPVQLVWDHGGGATGGGDGYEDTFLSFSVGNVQSAARRSIMMDLRLVNGALTYQFQSSDGEAFSASNNPTSSIYLNDASRPRSDLKAALGFSGYGTTDISDKLRFRMLATRGTTNRWSVTFEIFNITKNSTVVSRFVGLSTAGSTVDGGTATWQNNDDEVGIPTLYVHEGVKLFITPTALESLPAFSTHADKDNDGMPDLWEDANLLNKNSATDAMLDADSDSFKNRDEYLNGTNPQLRDTDGDGVDDRVEHEEGTNPLVAGLRPIFANGTQGSGTDFNQNGFPDAWEARFKATGLAAGADSDGDGATNSKEAAWGTDPFDTRSGIGLTLNRSGNDALLAWTRSPWKKQQLYRSAGLATWAPLSVSATPSGINDTARVTGQFTAARTAFFAMETLDKDSDGDGVSDWDEMMFGSDPYLRDSSRSSALTLDSQGAVTGSVSGDYAAFTANFKNALTGGSGQVSGQQAARFLQQASFGPTLAELDRVQTLGFTGWISDQITAQPASYHQPIIEAMVQDLRGPKLDLTYSYNNLELNGNNAPSAFARTALSGSDQLRQRVAFALSQILVASRRDSNLSDRPLAMANFYDIFVRHAFGNYRDILGEVTKHPVMGRYLSHVGNQKARPEINQFPDENYAREVMQLFTIGLWKLNQDGTRKLDGSGNFIPTYGNADITEMARVFTGFWFGGQRWSSGGGNDIHLTVPMEMWAEKHDFDSKSMLGGLSLPARSASAENGLRDVDAALDFLFNDPNTAPFICRQLIQFLVTSNPSPAYVGRVAAAFANNGSGKRGDLGAVVRAILLDIEARDARWSRGSASFGRLKDPVYRAMSLARVGHLGRFPTLNWWDYGNFYESSLQSPGSAPSVFNFYRPDYRSPGLLTDNQLAAPALQIMNSYTSIAFVNQLWQHSVSGIRLYSTYMYQPDYRDLLEVAATPPLLVDRVNLLLCGGMMSASTRASILTALSQVSASELLQRVQLTVFLASACPEGAVQR